MKCLLLLAFVFLFALQDAESRHHNRALEDLLDAEKYGLKMTKRRMQRIMERKFEDAFYEDYMATQREKRECSDTPGARLTCEWDNKFICRKTSGGMHVFAQDNCKKTCNNCKKQN